MASGRIAANTLTGNTYTVVYTVPSNNVASFTTSVTNFGTSNSRISLALSTANSATSNVPTNGEWITYTTVLRGGSTLEKTGLVLDAGKSLIAITDTDNLNILIYGFEEEI